MLQRQFRVRMGSDLAADEPAMCGRWIGLSTDFWPFRVENYRTCSLKRGTFRVDLDRTYVRARGGPIPGRS